MRPALFLSLFSALLIGCAGHDAYKPEADGFGYSGAFPQYEQHGNRGFVTFVGGENIEPSTLRAHTLRRIAELCRDKGYDYFMASSGRTFATTGLEQRDRLVSKRTDTHGNVWGNYKVWKAKVGAKGQSARFIAWRGPIPRNTAHHFHDVRQILSQPGGDDSRSIACESCGETVEADNYPEVHAACGNPLIKSVLCPFCYEPNAPAQEGAIACTHCDRGFRVAFCSRCGGRNTLRNFRPFDCAICAAHINRTPQLAADEFSCPHCSFVMRWPAELFGQYRCDGCRQVFTIRDCPKCKEPSAERTPDQLSCMFCDHKIRPPRPKQ